MDEQMSGSQYAPLGTRAKVTFAAGAASHGAGYSSLRIGQRGVCFKSCRRRLNNCDGRFAFTVCPKLEVVVIDTAMQSKVPRSASAERVETTAA